MKTNRLRKLLGDTHYELLSSVFWIGVSLAAIAVIIIIISLVQYVLYEILGLTPIEVGLIIICTLLTLILLKDKS